MHGFLKPTPRPSEPQDAGCRDDCQNLRYLIFKFKPLASRGIPRILSLNTLFILPIFSILLPRRTGIGYPESLCFGYGPCFPFPINSAFSLCRCQSEGF